MSRSLLHYVTHGEVSRPPVLLLHGFMGSSSDWEPITERLAAAFFCVCPDLPGHGASVDLDVEYTIDRTAGMLSAVLDEIGVERTNVVGYSMGGRVSLYYGLTEPARCRSLVLESASPGLPTDDERQARRGVDEARAVRLETGDYVEFLEEWYRQPLFETYQRREGLLDHMIRSRQTNSPRELARSLREMGTGSQPSLWERLDELRMPVLAMAGALDGKYVETAERMAVVMPRARTAILADTGHNLHAEKPDAFTDILLDFLKKPS